jgi:hypothetical protein
MKIVQIKNKKIIVAIIQTMNSFQLKEILTMIKYNRNIIQWKNKKTISKTNKIN